MVNLVIWDDGHYETTKGKCSHPFDDGYVLKENYFNSVVVEYGKAELNKYKCEILHVSNDKEDTPLKTRTDRANVRYKDLCTIHGKENVNAIFVSVHANHDGGKAWSQANGIDTFIYPKADDKFAKIVQSNLIKETGLRDRGVKQEDFHVLRETAMTAILCECGFMSNKVEANLLRSDSYRRKCAKAIIDGIVEYMKLERKEPRTFWRVITSSHEDINLAKKEMEELKSKGYKDAFVTKYIEEVK